MSKLSLVLFLIAIGMLVVSIAVNVWRIWKQLKERK